MSHDTAKGARSGVSATAACRHDPDKGVRSGVSADLWPTAATSDITALYGGHKPARWRHPAGFPSTQYRAVEPSGHTCVGACRKPAERRAEPSAARHTAGADRHLVDWFTRWPTEVGSQHRAAEPPAVGLHSIVGPHTVNSSDTGYRPLSLQYRPAALSATLGPRPAAPPG